MNTVLEFWILTFLVEWIINSWMGPPPDLAERELPWPRPATILPAFLFPPTWHHHYFVPLSGASLCRWTKADKPSKSNSMAFCSHFDQVKRFHELLQNSFLSFPTSTSKFHSPTTLQQKSKSNSYLFLRFMAFMQLSISF